MRTPTLRAIIRSLQVPTLFVPLTIAVPLHGESPPLWPPEHMKGLPPDYLGRLKSCLVAGTERLGRLNLETSKPTDSIGWVRYGQPSLLLGERTEEINRFFESDTF